MKHPSIPTNAASSVTVPTLAQAKKMSIAELRALLTRGALLSGHGIRLIAVAYVALRDRGEDMTAYNHGLIRYFDGIVKGRIDPQLLIEYAGAPHHLEQISRLVPEEQRKFLGSDARVNIAKRGPTGTVEAIAKKPAACTVTELAILCGEGKLRTIEEQKAYLPTPVVTPPPPPRTAATMNVDVWGILTMAQRDKLAAQAEQRGLTVAQFIRNLLVNNKVINGRVS